MARCARVEATSCYRGKQGPAGPWVFQYRIRIANEGEAVVRPEVGVEECRPVQHRVEQRRHHHPRRCEELLVAVGVFCGLLRCG